MILITDQSIQDLIEIRSIKPAVLTVRTGNSLIVQVDAKRELAASIREHGLIQPITVRPAEVGFEIVSGHRRYNACKLLRWKKIPCIVRILSDKAAFEIQLVENIQRKSLDPIEEAEAFKKYIVDYGWGGVSHLAKVISKSEQNISARIQLLRLPKEILYEISQKNLGVSHAMELVNLDEGYQQLLKDAIIDENLSVKNIREITKASKKEIELEQVIGDYNYNTSSQQDTSPKRQIKIFKKSLLVLRMLLSNLDGLINEANETLNPEERVEFLNVLMKFRLYTHSMIDDDIIVIKELKKKSSILELNNVLNK